MILAQLTALKLNLDISTGTTGMVQKNDNICLDGTLDVSGISLASSCFGNPTTVEDVVDAIESKWVGDLTASSFNWNFTFDSNSKNNVKLEDMAIKVLSGINEGWLVMSSGC